MLTSSFVGKRNAGDAFNRERKSTFVDFVDFVDYFLRYIKKEIEARKKAKERNSQSIERHVDTYIRTVETILH